MSTEIEQSRIDFEAYVSSITGSQRPLISMHWTGQGYSEASDLEPFWQCWTAAQIVATAHQTQGNGHPAIRLELVRYLTDGLHIRKWENIGDLPPGIHMLYTGQLDTPPLELVEPAAPYFYFVECDDPDYSGLYNHESEAQTQANDHGGEVVKLWNVPPTWRPGPDQQPVSWLDPDSGRAAKTYSGRYYIPLYLHPPELPAPVAADERKRTIDEISEAINRMPYTRKHLAECLYDAGYRKQVAP